MTEFKVEAMTCSHCVSAVIVALRRVDPEAQIDVDLAQKTVRIRSSRPLADLAGALRRAGYAPA